MFLLVTWFCSQLHCPVMVMCSTKEGKALVFDKKSEECLPTFDFLKETKCGFLKVLPHLAANNFYSIWFIWLLLGCGTMDVRINSEVTFFISGLSNRNEASTETHMPVGTWSEGFQTLLGNYWFFIYFFLEETMLTKCAPSAAEHFVLCIACRFCYLDTSINSLQLPKNNCRL